MARKNYPFNKRDEKKMNKLFSGLFAGLIAPIFSGSLDDFKAMSRKEECVYVLLMATVFTPIALYMSYDLFMSDKDTVGYLILFALVLIWVIAIYANCSNYKNK